MAFNNIILKPIASESEIDSKTQWIIPCVIISDVLLMIFKCSQFRLRLWCEAGGAKLSHAHAEL